MSKKNIISVNKMEEYAQRVLEAGILPRDTYTNVSQVIGAMLCARELGLSPVRFAMSAYFVGGKIALEAKVWAALALKYGITWEIQEADEQKAVILLHRAIDGRVMEYKASYTIEEARASEIIFVKEWLYLPKKPLPNSEEEKKFIKKNWKCWRQECLFWKAMGRGLRFIAPDIFFGIILPDEAETAEAMNTMERNKDVVQIENKSIEEIVNIYKDDKVKEAPNIDIQKTNHLKEIEINKKQGKQTQMVVLEDTFQLAEIKDEIKDLYKVLKKSNQFGTKDELQKFVLATIGKEKPQTLDDYNKLREAMWEETIKK